MSDVGDCRVLEELRDWLRSRTHASAHLFWDSLRERWEVHLSFPDQRLFHRREVWGRDGDLSAAVDRALSLARSQGA